MLTEKKVLGLIGRIYDAATDERLWPAFLEEFANAVDGEATAIVYHDMAALRADLAVSVRSDPEAETQYLNHYSNFDLLRKAWLERFRHASPESVVTSEQMIETAQFRRTEYFNDFLLPNNLVHSFCGPIVVNAERSAVFTCLRSQKQGPFDNEAVGILRLLLPHLQRAIYFHRRFAQLEGRHRASLDALDRLPTGLILLDAAGRILEVNRAAGHFLGQNDGLAAKKDGLAASSSNQTKELRCGIAAAARTAQGTGISATKCVRIERPSGKQPYSIVIMPISARAFPVEVHCPAVVVFVNDPEMKVQTVPEVLTRIYGLTAAEARLAAQLAQGETLVDAAEHLEVSHNTARTHLRRIFEKTNTRHQGDLVRLLLTGIVPFTPTN